MRRLITVLSLAVALFLGTHTAPFVSFPFAAADEGGGGD